MIQNSFRENPVAAAFVKRKAQPTSHNPFTNPIGEKQDDSEDKRRNMARVFDLVKWSRKAESWNARPITSPTVIEMANQLQEFPAGVYPTATFSGPRPQYHIAVCSNGDRFLVDTQGYDYARYIARLPDAGKSVREAQSFPRWDINKDAAFNPTEFTDDLSEKIQQNYKLDPGVANGIAQLALQILEEQGVVNKSESSERYQD